MSQDFSTATQPVLNAESVNTAPVEYSLAARLGAELFGTFFLVLAIIGVALYSIGTIGPGSLGGALAGGIALLACAAAVGHISGGHFNPAVSLGAAIAGRMPLRYLAPYMATQIVGAIVAVLILFATVPQSALAPLLEGSVIQTASKQAFIATTANGFGTRSPLFISTGGAFEFSIWTALLIETIVTGVFVAVILGVTDRRANDKVAPVAIGLTLTVGLLIAAPFTNGSLNPARSLGVAVFANSGEVWKQQWVFVVAPLLGAAIAALFYRAFALAPSPDLLLGEQVAVSNTAYPYTPSAASAGGATPVADSTPAPTQPTPDRDWGSDLKARAGITVDDGAARVAEGAAKAAGSAAGTAEGAAKAAGSAAGTADGAARAADGAAQAAKHAVGDDADTK